MNKPEKIFVVILFGTIYGLFWGSIYLLFSSAHGMIKMFNIEFIFGIATIFKIEILSKSGGFIYSFIDGSVIGALLGLFLLKITHFNPTKIIISKKHNQ